MCLWRIARKKILEKHRLKCLEREKYNSKKEKNLDISSIYFRRNESTILILIDSGSIGGFDEAIYKIEIWAFSLPLDWTGKFKIELLTSAGPDFYCIKIFKLNVSQRNSSMSNLHTNHEYRGPHAWRFHHMKECYIESQDLLPEGMESVERLKTLYEGKRNQKKRSHLDCIPKAHQGMMIETDKFEIYIDV